MAKTVKEWMKHHVKIDSADRKDWFLTLEGKAVLPVTSRQAFELLAHPDGAQIFRGVEECMHRKILEDDGNGRKKVQVENVSMWKVMMITGRVATRLMGTEDRDAGTIHLVLHPEPPKTPDAKPTPAEKMEIKWTIRPLSQAMNEAKAAKILPNIPAGTNVDDEYCYVVVEQSQSPKGINKLVANALKGFAKTLLGQTFEDLVAEALNIWRGAPTLRPYEECESIEINPNDEHALPSQRMRKSLAKSLARSLGRALSRITSRAR